MTQPLATQESSQSTRILLLGVWGHLCRRRRLQLGLLFLVMLASGGAELVSLGAVLPFLAVLSDPETLWQQPMLQALASQLGFTAASQLLLPATFTFAATAVLAALTRLLNLWLNGRLVAAIGSDLSSEAYRRTLYQPYAVHVQRNSATVITSLSSHIGYTLTALNSVLQVITAGVVATSLFTGLLLIDAPVAVAAAAIFGSTYSLLALNSQRELRRNGYKIAEVSKLRLKALQEGLGAIREVLLDGTQSTYLQIYRQADRPLRQLGARNSFLGSYSRYVVESLGMVAIALLGGGLVVQRGSGAAVISLLGALALGAQRLLPALQQIYSGWASLKSHNASIKAVLEMLNQPLPSLVSVPQPLPFRDRIRLVGVHFHYGIEQHEVLRGLDLEIRSGERIGLIGNTGSGKSTMVDLLMGLLKPTAGQLLVDGANLHDEANLELLAGWRAAISHVPQNIYLADKSILENIAFNVPRDEIDFSRVKLAAEQAQLADFIESSPEGYSSFVGERGIRLSGGQRQRVGIARALYKTAHVIVLDEATSALDSDTEAAVMSAVETLSKDLTIVIIAHRLSTVQRCDRVIRLSQGLVSADGNPQHVLSGID